MQTLHFKTEKELINECKKQNRLAQKQIFETHSPVLRAICYRYAGHEAEDILHEGFIKIFTNIKQYKGKGSFEGWLKRIVINTAISHVKKKSKQFHANIDEINEGYLKNDDEEDDDNPQDIKTMILKSDLGQDDIAEAINELPEGYKLIFNLYAIENYKHKEIAKMLNISTNTSKSQLSRARKILQKVLYEKIINLKK